MQRLLRGFDAVRRLCAQSDDLELRDVNPEEIRVGGGRRERLRCCLHTENLLMAEDLAMLRAYHELGLRVTGLVHAAPQTWIDCDAEQHVPSGLTEFGREVVHELNRAGHVDGRFARIGTVHRSRAGREFRPDRGLALQREGHQRLAAKSDGTTTSSGSPMVAASWGFTARPLSWILPANTAAESGPGIDASERDRGLKLLADVRSGAIDPFAAEAGVRLGARLSRSTKDFQQWGWTRWRTWWTTW